MELHRPVGKTDIIHHVIQIYNENHDQGQERREPELGCIMGACSRLGVARHGYPEEVIFDLRSADWVRTHRGGESTMGRGVLCAEEHV